MSNWNEADHPRVDAGKSEGGQFTDKDVSVAARAAEVAAKVKAEPLRFTYDNLTMKAPLRLSRKDMLEYISGFGSVNAKAAEDLRLADLYSRCECNDKPTVVPEVELQRMIDDGEVMEVWRGVGLSKDEGKAFADQFRYGDTQWAGRGIYGSGTYVAETKDTALGYGYGLIHAGIKASAKITTYDHIQDLLREDNEAYKKAPGSTLEGAEFFANLPDALLPAFDHNYGRYAVMKGFDGMRVETDVWVVWNRGALVVAKEDE